METFERDIFNQLKKIRKGEDVLVEHTSSEPIHLTFCTIINYVKQRKQRNTKVLLVDILDQLHLLKAHLELAGIDSSFIENLPVIKFGGIIKTGKILKRIELKSEISIWREQYLEALKEFQREEDNEFGIRIVVGIEKLIKLYEDDPRALETFFGTIIRPFLGNEKRILVTLINTSLINEEILQEFREHSSRSFLVLLSERKIHFQVIKSIDFEDYGKTFSIEAQELQNSLIK
ncbi:MULTISPECIES: DUF257 family protein [Thermococcus]|uniref:KaiC-like domain-containing protein n=2 Tax=Thermococcus sibiricus TaxID=172049 RepID=C6A1H3_THESM|nr:MULTISPECIES: DUF257 family protein [Thermococcus]KUK28951.1 MAG: Uncharacterized protein XD61_0510 [Thermococcus sp. 40_45]HII67160.1 DUF257 family protein [Thermococcaceae archaeon]ACS89468.1 hypothetical protein TSIB_0402 [Thermococcus sibiricus MM 739]KUK17668.1 MAG: Uncharacterized protein XD54_1033 [Thermococcus sibiricus]MBC7094690.1 DUF257 family protein [Thermococcus sp.]